MSQLSSFLKITRCNFCAYIKQAKIQDYRRFITDPSQIPFLGIPRGKNWELEETTTKSSIHKWLFRPFA